MKQKFLKYNLEQLLEENAFIAWVLHAKNKTEWEKFLDTHPNFKPIATKARKIVCLLHDKYDMLDEDSVLEIWKNIDKYEQQYKQKVRKIKFRRILSLAASVLLIISLGTFGYLYIIKKDPGYQFVSSDSPKSSEARMVLSTGEEIALKTDNSIIVMNDETSQVTINDSIIDLTKADAGKQEVQMNEVIIPYGKKTELLLADGTKVWLNAGSRMAFPSKFTGSNRIVFLEGEACFKVAHNEKQPFIVKINNLDIRVLGTHFNVAAYPAEETIETVLVEGSIALTRSKSIVLNKEKVILKPNQKAKMRKDGNEIIVSEETDVDMHIAWTYGWLKYKQESLASVLRKVERYYNVAIDLPVDYPADDVISGKLDLKDSLEEVILILSEASGFNYRIIDNGVIIEKQMTQLQRR